MFSFSKSFLLFTLSSAISASGTRIQRIPARSPSGGGKEANSHKGSGIQQEYTGLGLR